MQEQFLDVLYEDNHLLVVNKPAGIATQGAAAGRVSLHALAQQYLRRKYRKPGNVYLGVVSRLDAGTSGVVVFARTSKAAARLAEQFRGRSVEKEYWAVVEGQMEFTGRRLLRLDGERRAAAADGDCPRKSAGRSGGPAFVSAVKSFR